MKSKSNILNISLAAILLVSLAVGIILYTNLLKTKKVYADIDSQFNKDEKQLKNAQAEWTSLQKDIANANKAKGEKALAQTPTGMSTADPNKKLLNGMTLLEARKMVDKQVSTMKSSGASDAEIKSTLDPLLKNMGTSYDEVMSLPAQPSQPATTTQPSTSSGTSSSTSGSSSSASSGSSSSKSGGSSSSNSGTSSQSTVNNGTGSTDDADLKQYDQSTGVGATSHSGQDSGLSDTPQN